MEINENTKEIINKNKTLRGYYLNSLKHNTEHLTDIMSILKDNIETSHLYYMNIRKHIVEHHMYSTRTSYVSYKNIVHKRAL